MKKLISTLALAAVISPLSVANANQAFTGWNVGFDIGVIDAITKFDNSNEYFIPNVQTAYHEDFTGRLGRSAGVIGVVLGWNSCLSPCWNWGIEGRAQWSNLRTGHDNDYGFNVSSGSYGDTHVHARLNQQYGVVAKLGWVLAKCTQLYAFVGPQWGDFKHNTGGHDHIVSGGTVYDATNNGDHSKFKTGLLAGLGFEQMITACSSIGLEYDYGRYNHINHNLSAAYVTGTTPVASSYFNHNSSVNLTTNSMMLKFNYYWA